MEAEQAGDTGLMPKTLVLWFYSSLVLCFSQHFSLPMPFLNFYHVFLFLPLLLILKSNYYVISLFPKKTLQVRYTGGTINLQAAFKNVRVLMPTANKYICQNVLTNEMATRSLFKHFNGINETSTEQRTFPFIFNHLYLFGKI